MLIYVSQCTVATLISSLSVINNSNFKLAIDTGASCSLINPDYIRNEINICDDTKLAVKEDIKTDHLNEEAKSKVFKILKAFNMIFQKNELTFTNQIKQGIKTVDKILYSWIIFFSCLLVIS